MEGLFLLLALFFVGGWGLGVAGFARAGRARREAAALRAEVAALRAELGGMAGAMIAAGFRPPEAAAAPVSPGDEGAFAGPAAAGPRMDAAPPDAGPSGAEAPPAADTPLPPWSRPHTPGPRRSLEELITQRWGVWLGAGALLMAGVFLIRFAVEEGWLGPGIRCALAGLLGLALILGAEWLARRSTATEAGGMPDYAPPALAAGGVAALFGATYAASVLYGLLPPLAGFAGMAAAGALGMLLSLRRGPLVAVVGLAGAFATPALVAADHPSLPGLFAYLLVVVAAAMLVVRATAWGWLGWCATVAGALWVLAGTVMGAGLDLWAPALFVPAAAACFLFLLPREALSAPLGRRLMHLPPALLGMALLPLTVFETGLAAPVGILLLSPVAILAGLRDARLIRLPAVAAALGLVMLLAWQLPAWSPTGEAVTVEGVAQAFFPGAWAPAALTPYLAIALLLALSYLLAGLALETRGGLAWAGLAAAVPVLVLLAAYARVRGFAADPRWALAAAALAALHVGAAARAMRAAGPHRAGAHAAGATAGLALGVAMVLRDQWLTLAVALFLPPLAMIAARTGLDALRRVAAVVAAVVLVRLALNGFVLGYDWGRMPLLNGLLLAYGVPAGCFWWAARIFLRGRDGIVVRLLECGAALFATLLVLLEIRHAFHPGALAAEAWEFAEAAWQCTALFACAAAALLMHRRDGRVALLWAARAAGVAGLLVGIILLMANPWVTDREVGALPLLNALAPAYLLPALLAGWAVARAPELRRPPGTAQLLAAYALAAGFAWVTLEVRRAFHPQKIGRMPVGEAEMYAYSGAWLLLGAAMVAVGIRSGRKEIRLAALAVIALATFKVFLVDMDALVGLWRVLSFLGLGLALIALGEIYRRFVVTRPPPGAGDASGHPAPS